MAAANTEQTRLVANEAIINLLDVETLNQQLSPGAENSLAKTVSILKQAVVTIDEGLKLSYQNGTNVNAIVYGRKRLKTKIRYKLGSKRDRNMKLIL